MDAAKTGTLIAEIRKERDLTQKDLAQSLHVSVQAVSKWERGLNFPDIALLEPLAELLGLTVSELLSGERNAPAGEELVRSSLRASLEQLDGRIKKWRGLFFTAAAVLLCLGLWRGYVWVRDNTEWLPQKETVITPRESTQFEHQASETAGQDHIYFFHAALADDFSEYDFQWELWTEDGLTEVWDHTFSAPNFPVEYDRHQTITLTFNLFEQTSFMDYGFSFLTRSYHDSLADFPFESHGATFDRLNHKAVVDREYGVVLLNICLGAPNSGATAFRAPIKRFTGTGTADPIVVYEGEAVLLLRLFCK